MYRAIFLLLFSFFGVIVEADEIKTIAFAQDNMANDFRKAQVLEAQSQALKNKNLRFISSDAKGNTALLIYQIENFIKQKVDLIIVGTNDASAVVPVVSKAYHSGIAVIILDRGINSKEYTTFINSDNLKIGALGASFIAKKLNNSGTVLLFEGLQTADVTQLRSKGFLDEMAKHKGIKVIKRTGNYLRKDAIIETEKLFEKGVHVDAIFSESDSMLSGVRSVFYKQKSDPSKLIMVGCDYTSEAREAIKNGSQTASVLFPLGGTKAVEIAQKIFAKEEVPKHIVIPVKLISKENVMQVEPIF
ncbi:substrate-binding domain-containing protein [Sulfuricurvum sp.]|uniref:substrate-binding domain-containing protein n=1 Tax=Sulfuricurvum sp. TaxID=2025608 RepID=UPI0025DE7EBC|nr:substrate-binding domain-containing protein [Sulfuricurvum sp.]